MEKLKKTANGLDIVCKVLFWILIVAMALLLISFAVALIVDKDTFSTNIANGWTFSVGGGVSFKLSPESGINLDYSPEDAWNFNMRPFLTAAMIIGFAVSGIILYALKIIRNMLKPMKNGEPFDSVVGSGFRKLGWFTIIIGVAVNVFEIFGKTVITKLLINTLENADLPFEIAIQHTYSVTFILVAFLFFLLSYVFRYGEELQKLSDETL